MSLTCAVCSPTPLSTAQFRRVEGLFDQNVPRPLQRYLTAHDVKRTDQLGWSELTNGDLLRSAEDASFEAVLSGDKKLRHEQNMAGRLIAVVCMSDNHWPIVKRHIPAIVDALKAARPGTLTTVDCGRFAPGKLRRHDPLS